MRMRCRETTTTKRYRELSMRLLSKEPGLGSELVPAQVIPKRMMLSESDAKLQEVEKQLNRYFQNFKILYSNKNRCRNDEIFKLNGIQSNLSSSNP